MLNIKQIYQFVQQGPRSNQEDSIYPDSPSAEQRLFLLCDGMGGHGHGELASQTCVQSIASYLNGKGDVQYTADDIQAAADCAVDAITARSMPDSERTPGTTLVVAAMNPMELIIGHVGDSRAYLFGSDGSIKYRSHDHSRVQEAVDNGILTEEEARTSPYKNIITRALMGDGEHKAVEFDYLHPDDNDILLICSDGVTDALDDRTLRELFIALPFEEACATIAARSDDESHDNNTAIIIQFTQDEAYPRADKNVDKDVDDEPPLASNPENERTAALRFCSSCGAPLPDSARFCPSCGRNLAAAPDRDPMAEAGRCIRSGLNKGLGFLEDGIRKLRNMVNDEENNPQQQ